jgi:hypothetical protein
MHEPMRKQNLITDKHLLLALKPPCHRIYKDGCHVRCCKGHIQVLRQVRPTKSFCSLMNEVQHSGAMSCRY